MSNKPELDLNNLNVGFIITGMLGLVEDDKKHPREVFELLDLIKNQTFHALMDVYRGEA